MKKNNLLTLTINLGLLACIACNNSNNTTNTSRDTDTINTGNNNAAATAMEAHADISATKSDTTGRGSADFRQKDDGTVEMNLKIDFPSLANKTVAVHIHEHGDCGDAGKGAHGHWNPTNEKHGKWDSSSYHSGDIGNVKLDDKGHGELTLSTNRWTIGGDEKTNILNRGMIVHSGVDDYTSQPSGNSGSRIGCGVIMASSK
ncbi:superoxide dismutase family protein [Rubrolithibacter danxiaensis]|uniref:superoxide dismutase family protein n=1 Tax=Rubrolithibacter danxiaensis TaxID=3390805 RepID=UPI003BF7EFE1